MRRVGIPRAAAIALLVVGVIVLGPGLAPVRGLLKLAQASLLGEALLGPLADGELVTVTLQPRVEAEYHAGSSGVPLVIFVHGSSPPGRRASTPVFMIHALLARGFPVLALDLRGFGASAAAPQPWTEVGFDGDVLAAARLAEARGWAPRGFVYMGHSLGAGVVLRAALKEPRPIAVISNGAPATRTYFARGEAESFTRDRFESMRLEPDPRSFALMRRFLLDMDPTRVLAEGDLPPVLLMYGEHDRALAHVRAGLPPLEANRLRLLAVPGVGHALGARRQLFGVVSHPPRTTELWMSELVAWLRERYSSGGASPREAP
jgi:pimeloyl-ACP methyl ester carboxylesterase